MKKLIGLAITCLLFAGCAFDSQRQTAPRPDLSGQWTFEVRTGQNVVQGAMTLIAESPGYRGTLTTDQGSNVLPVRSLTVDGSAMDMIVESPQGAVTFKGALSDDASSFEGTVTYHNGQAFPMSGRKGAR